ncbi:MAG: hypothetical protein AB1393_04275 [Candidatus Edwardsbacteria bacterium]
MKRFCRGYQNVLPEMQEFNERRKKEFSQKAEMGLSQMQEGCYAENQKDIL